MPAAPDFEPRVATALRPAARPEAGPGYPLSGTGLELSPELSPALTAWIEQVRRVTDAATLILLLIAALVFVLPSLGASLP